MNLRTHKIGEICDLIRGTSPTLKTVPGLYPLVVTAEFRRSSDSWQLEGPAVCVPLISSTGHGDAALHRVHYQEGRFALANLLVALKPNQAVCDAKYLYHLLMRRKDELLVPLMLGTANVSLKERDIASAEIVLPSLDLQHRIVARIEDFSAQIAEVRQLQKAARDTSEELLVSMAHRVDLSSEERERLGWRRMKLSEIMRLVDDSHIVLPTTSYPNFGIYSFGRGLFHKTPIDGMLTSAKSLRRVQKGQFIYSRLFAFEGAYGMVTEEFDGAYVSSEYPTFECDASQVRAEFLVAYFKPSNVWQAVAVGSKGLGHRRQRVQPDQVLSHRAWVPPIDWQNRLAEVQRQLSTANNERTKLARKLDALLPSILDRAFRGEF